MTNGCASLSRRRESTTLKTFRLISTKRKKSLSFPSRPTSLGIAKRWKVGPFSLFADGNKFSFGFEPPIRRPRRIVGNESKSDATRRVTPSRPRENPTRDSRPRPVT